MIFFTFLLFWISIQFGQIIEDSIAYVIVLSIGIIHGSNDFTILRKQQTNTTKFLKSTGFYLLLIILCVLSYLANPFISFLFFILLSSYHFGESGWDGGLLNAYMWGLLSGLAYFYIAYEVWLGSLKKLAEAAGGNVLKAHKTLCWFLLVGWAIYPLGYMAGTDGWYNGIENVLPSMEVIYNIGDAINKIGFGLVVYTLAVSKD